MKSLYVITLDGKKRMHSTLTVTMHPEDIDEVDDSVGLRNFAQDLANGYSSVALRNGLDGDPQAPLVIYMTPDNRNAPNHPRVSEGRTHSTGRLFVVTPGERASFGASLKETAEEPPLKLQHDLLDSPTRSFSHNPSPTLPYAAREAVAEGSDPSPTRPYSAPRQTAADREPSEPNDDAPSWMRDVRDTPRILRDGRVETHLGWEPIEIGRDQGCCIRLVDDTVSRHHAIIEYRDGQPLLVPADGRVCWVNDVAFVTPLVLADGDILAFASSPERFEYRG